MECRACSGKVPQILARHEFGRAEGLPGDLDVGRRGCGRHALIEENDHD